MLSPDNPGRLSPAAMAFLPGALPGRGVLPDASPPNQLGRSTVPASSNAMQAAGLGLVNGLPFGGGPPPGAPAAPPPPAEFRDADLAPNTAPIVAAPIAAPIVEAQPLPLTPAAPAAISAPPMFSPAPPAVVASSVAIVAPPAVVVAPVVIAPPAVVVGPVVVAPPAVVAPPMIVEAQPIASELPPNVVVAPAENGLPERPIFAAPDPSLLAPVVTSAEPPRVGSPTRPEDLQTFGPTGTVVGNGLSAVSAPGFAAAAAAADAQNAAAAAAASGEPDSPWLRAAPPIAAPEYKPEIPAADPEPAIAPPKPQGRGGNTTMIVVAAVVVLGLAGAGFAFRKDLAGAFGSAPAPNNKPVQLDTKTAQPANPTTTPEPSVALPPPLPPAIPAPETALPKSKTPPVTAPTPNQGQGGTPPVRPPATTKPKTEPKFTPTEL